MTVLVLAGFTGFKAGTFVLRSSIRRDSYSEVEKNAQTRSFMNVLLRMAYIGRQENGEFMFTTCFL